MAKFTSPKQALFILGLLACLFVACQLSSPIATHESKPAPEIMTTDSETSHQQMTLPAPLYYLQAGQIWRLSPDTQTQLQITKESASVDAFDISAANGRLVYISNNSLIIADSLGQNRQVLRDGPQLADLPDELARLNDLDQITFAIRTPLWSPDGTQIAFIENGMKMYDVETHQVEQIWSQSVTSSEPNIFESLLSWSPDGKYLLLSQYTYPIEHLGHRRLSVLELSGGLYIDIAATTQSTFAWSPDSAQLYLANDGFGWDNSLMRCDMPGVRCTLIAEFVPARTYYFYAHPFVINEHELMVFSGSSNDPDQQPADFKLYKITYQGYGYQTIRSDGFLPKAALWSPDGDGVVITLAVDAEAYPAGSALFLSTSDLPAIPLPIMNASNLLWGVEP